MGLKHGSQFRLNLIHQCQPRHEKKPFLLKRTPVSVFLGLFLCVLMQHINVFSQQLTDRSPVKIFGESWKAREANLLKTICAEVNMQWRSYWSRTLINSGIAMIIIQIIIAMIIIAMIITQRSSSQRHCWLEKSVCLILVFIVDKANQNIFHYIHH